MNEKILIVGVKTDRGFYIREGGSSYGRIYSLLVNGRKLESTFHNYWFLTDSEPKTVERVVSQPNINHRFELKEDIPWVGGADLPKVMPRDEVIGIDESGESCGWKEELKHLQGMYEAKSDPQPNKIEPVEFSYTTILEIPEIKIEENFKYPVQKTSWESDGIIDLKSNKIVHQWIDQIVFPEIVLTTLPSRLSSEDSYRIIRQHIKQNIDPRYATITSDYRFCFEVSKTIPLSNTKEFQTEIKNARGRSYKKKRFKQHLVVSRDIKKVFEMTYSPENYRGYTPIKGFLGTDHQDLKKNIDKFLDDLMARINEPLTDCPHCNGMGVVSE